MKIETELRDDHQVKLTVEIDPEPLESAKHQAARKIAKKVKIPGFRPGKAPYPMVVRHVGEGAILEEAMEFLIDDIYPKVIEEAEITPHGPGKLENIVSMEPPIFEFIVPLESEVVLGDYKSISIPYEPPAVTQAEIDAAIEQMRQKQSITENIDSPAQEGNRIFFRVSAERLQPAEGQDAAIFPERFHSMIILPEDKDTNQWPFPGFGQQLKGLSGAEQKSFDYTYPADYEDEDLRGVQARFHVTVTNVQSITLPALDDEFAKSASEFDTLEALLEDVKKHLEEEAAQAYNADYDNLVLDKITAESTIKFPPQMLEREKKDMISGLEYRLSQQGLSKEIYLQIRGQTEEQLLEEITPIATKRIKHGLTLVEIAKAENIEVDSQQLRLETGRTVNSITRNMTPKEQKEFQQSPYLYNLVNNIMVDMLTEKTMEYLRATAKGEPWPPVGSVAAEARAGELTPGAETSLGQPAPAETPESEMLAIAESESDPQTEQSAEA